MAPKLKSGQHAERSIKGNNMLLGAGGGSGWAPHHTSGPLVKVDGRKVVPADVLEVPAPAVNPPVERRN